MITSIQSTAWETLTAIVRESPAETYTKSQVLGLMARVLKEAHDSWFMRDLDRAIQQVVEGERSTL